MNAALASIDLTAAAYAEYERRRKGWIAVRDRAVNSIERARILTQANADLLVWQGVVGFVEKRFLPGDDSRPMARSARNTLDKARESGKVSNEKFRELRALWRHLYVHACYRHGWDWDQPAERKAA